MAVNPTFIEGSLAFGPSRITINNNFKALADSINNIESTLSTLGISAGNINTAGTISAGAITTTGNISAGSITTGVDGINIGGTTLDKVTLDKLIALIPHTTNTTV